MNLEIKRFIRISHLVSIYVRSYLIFYINCDKCSLTNLLFVDNSEFSGHK